MKTELMTGKAALTALLYFSTYAHGAQMDLTEVSPYLSDQNTHARHWTAPENGINTTDFATSNGVAIHTTIENSAPLSAKELELGQGKKIQLFKSVSHDSSLNNDDDFLQSTNDTQGVEPMHTTDERVPYAQYTQQAEATVPAAAPAVEQTALPSEETAEPALPPTEQLNIGERQKLLDFVETWRRAWSAKDIETYMTCYSRDFQNGDLDKDGWQQKKSRLNGKYNYIHVAIDNIIVEQKPEEAKISFLQHYESDQYKTAGQKTLQLVVEDGQWKISKED